MLSSASAEGYEAPTFEELGSFTELTQGRRGNPFFFDCFGTSAV